MGIFPFVFSLVHRLVCRAVSSHYYKWCYLRFLDKAEEEIKMEWNEKVFEIRKFRDNYYF